MINDKTITVVNICFFIFQNIKSQKIEEEKVQGLYGRGRKISPKSIKWAICEVEDVDAR